MVDFKNYFEKIHASKTEDENYIQENYDTIIQKKQYPINKAEWIHDANL